MGGAGVGCGGQKELKVDKQVDCNKQMERNAPYFAYEGAHIRN